MGRDMGYGKISKISLLGNVGIGTNDNINKQLVISGTNPEAVIRAGAESQKSTLYLATPFNSASALKCALIVEGVSSYSRSKFHIALNGTGDNSTAFNASVNDSRFTITCNGNAGLMNTSPINSATYEYRLNIGNSATTYPTENSGF